MSFEFDRLLALINDDKLHYLPGIERDWIHGVFSCSCFPIYLIEIVCSLTCLLYFLLRLSLVRGNLGPLAH